MSVGALRKGPAAMWTITFKPSFLTQQNELNREQRDAIGRALNELERDPISPRGDTIKKLSGYTNVYRYRLGDYRLLYAANATAEMIQLLAVGPRGNVYEGFNYHGWNAPGAAVEFGPELSGRPEWVPPSEWFRPPSAPLPRRLTPELLERWRVDAVHHAALVDCRTEDDLFNLMTVPEEVVTLVLDALTSPTADRLADQPDYVLFDPADLDRYAEGTLAGFLLRLDEEQEPLTRWALRGPTLVKGGPGSGKSTVALYRARAVVDHHRQREGRLPSVLFTTYTNALTNVSESLLRQLLADTVKPTKDGKLPREFRVSTLDKTAQWIAKGGGEKYDMADDRARREALHAARAMMRPTAFGQAELLAAYGQVKDLRDDYVLDEFDWVIEGQNCRAPADYLRADRTGRGAAFTQERRAAVWRLYEAYRAQLAADGRITWGELTQRAIDRVKSGEFRHRYDYVIVDEAQDLKPAGLRLAVELCRSSSGVFLTADANQSLYNRGFRWRAVHDALALSGRTRALRRNYRSTRPIALAAAEIMAGDGQSVDDETLAQEYVHSGPRPVLYGARSHSDEWRQIAAWIGAVARETRLPVSAAAVLVPSSEVGRPLADALSDHGLPARFMASREFDLEAPGVKVTTLHAAKGLEFPLVAVAHVEAGRLPRGTEGMDAEEQAAYEEAQRRLFYVGCTRAMRRLLVTYDRALPSPFLAGLSGERWEIA